MLICKRVYFSQEEQVKLYYRVLFLVNTYGQYETALSAEVRGISSTLGGYYRKIFTLNNENAKYCDNCYSHKDKGTLDQFGIRC